MYMSGRKLTPWFQPLPRKPGHLANLIPTQKCPMPRARAWMIINQGTLLNKNILQLFFAGMIDVLIIQTHWVYQKIINLNKGFFCTNFLDEFEQ